MSTTPEYALGSDDAEVARLDAQAASLAAPTMMLLRAAGVGTGMRVLDLGTGLGHVAFALADLVGPSGSVTGVDQSDRLLDVAEQRRAASGRDHVRFVEGDVRTYRPDDAVDVVVARLLLFHLPDAGDVLCHHAEALRPGGTAVMLDFDIGAARAFPPVALVEQAKAWVDAGFRSVGADPSIGARLGRLMHDAGFVDIRSLGVQPYLAPDDPAGPRLLGGVLRAVAPAVVAAGVAGSAELALDTFDRRLSDELLAASAVFLPPALVGAWGRR